MNEREFEDILCKYPELIEESLIFCGRQYTIEGKRVDILFEDKYGQKLIVELKKGTILRKDIAQLLDYEGYFLSIDSHVPRIMLIGNLIPENLKRSLDNHGIEHKEIKIADLVQFLENKNDTTFLNYVIQDEPLNTGKVTNSKIASSKILDYTQKTIDSKSKGSAISKTGAITPIKSFLSKQLLKIKNAKSVLNKNTKQYTDFFVEDRYSFQSRLNLLSPELRNYFIEFHKQLVSSIDQHMPPPKTNNRGVTYFATNRNVFIWVEFNKASISLNFYTGGESVVGLQTTMWRNAGDGKGGRFRIKTEDDIHEAVKFGKFSYQKKLSEKNNL